MNTTHDTSLLDRATAEARTQNLDKDFQLQAQNELLRRIEEHPRRHRQIMGTRWAFAVPLVGVTLGMTLWLGGLLSGNGGAAFAAVQDYFLRFQTLRTHMQLSVAGQPAMEMDILIDEKDRARIEMPDVMTLIVNGREGWMLTLLQSGMMQWTEFPPGESAPADQLEWLYEIRDFQGQAHVLDELQTVNGELARGYELTLVGSRMTLWATASDNRPLRMEGDYSLGEATQGMQMVLDFSFDEALPQDAFEPEIPEGYFWMGEPPAFLD